MSKRRFLPFLALSLALVSTGCGAQKQMARTVLDVVDAQCVVLRKTDNFSDPNVQKACATVEELEPYLEMILAARQAAARREGMAAPPPLPAPASAPSGAPVSSAAVHR